MQRNSIGIANAYPEVYQEVLGSCQWVASAPGVFFWAGEHAVLSGGIAVCQQIPLRVYVGLELVDPARQEFDLRPSAQAKDHRELVSGNFGNVTWAPSTEKRGVGESRPIASSELSPEMNDVLRRLANELELFGSYEFRSLHELRRAWGSGWSGAFSSALVGALFAATNKIEPGDAWKADGQRIAECNRWAWEFERIFHGGFASACATLVGMRSCAAPQLYAMGWRKNCPDDKSSDYSKDPQHLDEPPIPRDQLLADRLSANSVPLCADDEWQEYTDRLGLDFGLISSGREKTTATSIGKTTKELEAHFRKALATAIERWPALDVDGPTGPYTLRDGPMFRTRQEHGGLRPVDMRFLLMEALAVSGILVTEALASLVSGSTFHLKELAEGLDRVAAGLSQMGLGWKEADLVRAALLEALWADSKCVGLKPTGGAHGGYLLFVAPRLCGSWRDGFPQEGSLGAALVEALAGLKPLSEHVASLDWCNSRDGLDGRGLQVELTPDHRRLAALERGEHDATLHLNQLSYLVIESHRQSDGTIEGIRSTVPLAKNGKVAMATSKQVAVFVEPIGNNLKLWAFGREVPRGGRPGGVGTGTIREFCRSVLAGATREEKQPFTECVKRNFNVNQVGASAVEGDHREFNRVLAAAYKEPPIRKALDYTVNRSEWSCCASLPDPGFRLVIPIDAINATEVTSDE